MGRRGARGFSLLEMILVLALVALASLLAAAALTGGFDGMRLRAAAREVAAQLRFTRAQAIATGESQRFTQDARAHRWTAPKARSGEMPAQLALAFVCLRTSSSGVSASMKAVARSGRPASWQSSVTVRA